MEKRGLFGLFRRRGGGSGGEVATAGEPARRPGRPVRCASAARGRSGERAAERALRDAGLDLLARNWRGGGGELDLVALDGETLVFVEVKSRAAFDPARAKVRTGQRRRNASAARAFRARFGVSDLAYRFDLVTVEGDPPALDWRRGAAASPRRRIR